MKEKKKWILRSCGVVILGAVGSGLWDVALKPGTGWFGRILLTGVTLGFETARNSVYEDVARGNSERAALYSLYLLASAVAAMAFSFLAYWAGRSVFDIQFRRANTREELDRLMKEDSRPPWRMLALSLLALASIVVVRYAMISYADVALTHYRQSLTICRPYLESKEVHHIESQFALIRSKGEYVRILSRLDEVARTNGVELPEFKPW